jgi:NADH-quinone oxidoreductase chain G
MIKVFVNNKSVIVPKNTSALEACEAVGIIVPRFCYHERLNVAGNCRMCLVEIEKTPKPIASCAFPVAPNMRIYTDTPLVHKARENVLEFLLINHPLDCPICDQGGECDLQEQTMVFGSDRSRFFYSKRSVEDKNCGLLIKTIMTRCIHCTRCVRFLQDIAGQEEFGTTLRGQKTEIGTYLGKTLDSELSGNIIDLCPVGALTSKPYAFTARPWEVKSAETIDISDSVGSNIKVNFKESEILRILPALNDTLNEEWISDKTRFSFDGLKVQRIAQPYFQINNHFSKIGWRQSIRIFSESIQSFKENEILIICGDNLDLSTLKILKLICKSSNISLISENYFEANNNLMSNLRFNTTFSDILNSDLCLTIATNVRFEASLLNVRLKKQIRKGNFVKASIGLADDCTYLNDSIGNSINTFLAIAEGKHSFSKSIAKSKKPLIILGSSIKKRVDSEAISSVIKNLAEYCTIVDEDWFGINFLPLSSNFVGKSFLGIQSNNKINLENKKFIHCVGLDFENKIFSKALKNESFTVVQSPYFAPWFKKANLILPATAFIEKEGERFNLESRVQKTVAVLNGPNLARNDEKIISTLFFESLKKNPNKNLGIYVLPIEENKKCFSKNITFTKNNFLSRYFKTPLKPILSNFFSSNIITNNSRTMGKCSSVFKNNYLNFKQIIV